MVLNCWVFLPSRERIYFFILKKFFRLKFENLNLDILIKNIIVIKRKGVYDRYT